MIPSHLSLFRTFVWCPVARNELTCLPDKVILVGHSLGGSVLLKYLSEAPVENTIVGLFVIAAPYWGAEDWQVDEYMLRDNVAAYLPQIPLLLYHGQRDEIVPFEHLAMYGSLLPQAKIREFEGRGHKFNDDLSEVAADIATLQI